MIIFQQFDKNFNDIANLVIPHNKKYCELHNITYINFIGEFDEFYNDISHGAYKNYWTKIILLKYVLENYNDNWVLMLDGDVVINNENHIIMLSSMLTDDKHIGLCRASSDIREYWNINIGCMLVRNSDVSKQILDNFLAYGKSMDFNVYEQAVLQKVLKYEDNKAVEIFPPIVFNHTGGPFLFHPCGAGYTTTTDDPQQAIKNKLTILKQEIDK